MQGLLFIAMLALFAVIAYKLISRKLKLRGHEINSSDMLVRYSDGPYIVDVRTPDEYRQGHIPGVKLVPLNELGRRYKEIPQDREVYIICHSGSRSAEAVIWLLKKGYDQVFNISGGMNHWQGPVAK